MASEAVKTATDANFQSDVLKSPVLSMVDFWAVWCGPCRALAPVVDEVAEENKGKVNVFKLNVDENPDTAANYGIRGIPTILFFKGGQMVKQIVGVVPKAELEKQISQLA